MIRFREFFCGDFVLKLLSFLKQKNDALFFLFNLHFESWSVILSVTNDKNIIIFLRLTRGGAI